MNKKQDDTSHGHPWLAFALSCLLPGAGLAYLGRWWSAALNLAIAVLAPLGALAMRDEGITEHIHYLFLVIAVGSGAWAHAKALQSRKQP